MNYTPETASRLYLYFADKLKLGRENAKGWMTGDCPTCGKAGKFGINLVINQTNCFVCGTKTKPIMLVKELEGFQQFSQVIKLINTYESFNFAIQKTEKVKTFAEEVLTEQEGEVISTLPKEYRMISFRRGIYADMVKRKLLSRGITIEQAMHLGLGYCTTGDYQNRLIIPFYRKGEIVYFHAWTIVPHKFKYKNPDEVSIGIGKGQVIYNYDALNTYSEVWMFEGVFNAITIGSRATATGGKQLSDWQLSQYIGSKCSKIIIAWDDDGYIEALSVAMKIAPYKEVKVLKFPKGLDANDLGRAKTKKINKATPYQSYKELYKLYINERAKHSYQ